MNFQKLNNKENNGTIVLELPLIEEYNNTNITAIPDEIDYTYTSSNEKYEYIVYKSKINSITRNNVYVDKNINWEQRKYEIAKDLLIHHPTLFNDEIITRTNEFINLLKTNKNV